MSSLGFSEYAESGNLNNNNVNGNGNGNGHGKIYNRRNGNGTGTGSGNRTLKIPRNHNQSTTEGIGGSTERGLLQSPNGNDTGISNENGTNQGMIQQAGQKIKQIKDYIENIHRKGGEDSDPDDDDSILPAYPAQGMGVYATNITSQGVIRGPDNVSSNNGVVRKTTQMNSLNPSSSYSSTLLEGMNPADSTNEQSQSQSQPQPPGTTAGASGRFSSPPHFTTPYGDTTRNVDPRGKPKSTVNNFSTNDDGKQKTSIYASKYYEQFVPYAETLANQLAGDGRSGGGSTMSGTNAALIEKLNYIIHMLEDKKDEKTGHVIEELVLYCFLGIFIIFIVDTFTHTIPGNGRAGGAGGGFTMFGGAKHRIYRR
jgi:hypothetical protein